MSKKTHHNRKVQFMRYIFKRKQCVILALIQVAVLVMLTAFCIGAYFGYQIFNDKRIEIDNENTKIGDYSGQISFAHCKYKDTMDFDTQFCKNPIGFAFAFRYHVLENENDETCYDFIEQMDCHEYLIDSSVSKSLLESSSYQNRCPGFSNASLVGARNYSLNHDRMVPLDLDDSTALKNLIKDNQTIVLVQQLFIKCPKCNIDEEGGERCKIKIKTAENGWPWFAETCNEFQIIDCQPTAMIPGG